MSAMSAIAMAAQMRPDSIEVAPDSSAAERLKHPNSLFFLSVDRYRSFCEQAFSER
jgi:hypothetical protein